MYYVVLNFKDASGKRRQKWIPTGLEIKGNKRKAEKRLYELISEYDNSTFIEPTKILLCDFITQWVEKSKCNLQVTTYDMYVHMLNKHIYPFFKGNKLPLHTVSPLDIQNYYITKINEGLSPNTVIKHHAIIRSSLQYAVKMKLIKENVCDLVDKPKRQKFLCDYYNKDEINTLLSFVKGSAIETPVFLASYFGLRRSEILGLKWSAINFNERQITIRHKVVRAKKDGKLTINAQDDLKTHSSYRTLPLDNNFYEYLLGIKSQQEENKILFNDSYNNSYSDYVCVNEEGVLLNPDYITSTFIKILKKNNLKRIRFHDLRHSCASLLLSLGYSMKDIQEWLGHSNYQTTANIYAHVDPRNKKEMAKGISNSLNI